jgi:hypothetical protein
LRENGILLQVKLPSGAFWQPEDLGNDTYECVIDVVFVDDECILPVARSAASLVHSVTILCELVVVIVDALALEINWNPGETEGFLRFRGKRSTEQCNRVDGRLHIPVPGCNGKFLHIVDKHRHVGTVIASDGNVLRDASIDGPVLCLPSCQLQYLFSFLTTLVAH